MTASTHLRRLTVALALATVLAILPARADESDGIAGVWWTPRHDGKIAISLDGTGVASGRLIAVSPDDADGTDDKNPDPSLRARPLLGLTVLQGFALDADGILSGGTAYDPDSGRTYYATLSFDRAGHVVMRGSVLFNLFWRTEILERVAGPLPTTQQPGEPDLVYVNP